MNKCQDALDDIMHDLLLSAPPTSKRFYEPLKSVLQELVDKATPMKPIKIKLGALISGDFHLGDTNTYQCPVCQRFIAFGRCCHDNNCRQAIDWTKEEENR